MRKILIIKFLLAISFVSAQIHRFYYQFTYQPDKDSANTIEKMTVLDILNKESLYASYDQIVFDSLSTVGIRKMRETGLEFNWDKIGRPPLLSDRIIKNGNEIIYKDRKDFASCQYKEKLNLAWKIEKDKSIFENYNTQKATLDFGGRNWIAWFTTEIPLQEGPYKFFGLPGLIVKIEDDNHNFSWKLVGNKKYQSTEGLQKFDYFELQDGVAKTPFIDKKKCLSILEDYRKNYFSNLMQMFPPEMKDAELIQKAKEDSKRMEKIFSENDNFIEIQ